MTERTSITEESRVLAEIVKLLQREKFIIFYIGNSVGLFYIDVKNGIKITARLYEDHKRINTEFEFSLSPHSAVILKEKYDTSSYQKIQELAKKFKKITRFAEKELNPK